MTQNIDADVKSKFVKLFRKNDWRLFKSTGDYYLKRSALLKRSDIGVSGQNSLLIRNIQKRLFLGIGGELLVKSFYLKKGYTINTPKDRKTNNGYVYELGAIGDNDLVAHDTFAFGALIDNIHKIETFANQSEIKEALTILRIFRNKEGHVVTGKHTYDPSTYEAIENGIRFLYNEGFSETLSIKIGMVANEAGRFSIRKQV